MKFRIKLTLEREYTPFAEYTEGMIAGEILGRELDFLRLDPAFILNYKDTKIEVSGEVLEQ